MKLKITLCIFFLIVLIGCSDVKIVSDNPEIDYEQEVDFKTITSENQFNEKKEITTQTEYLKLENTRIIIDKGLDKKEILDYLKTFNLYKIQAIYFLNNWKFNDEYYYVFGDYGEIHLHNMKYLGVDENWKYSFNHGYSHHYCYITFDNLSEECTNRYQVTW